MMQISAEIRWFWREAPAGLAEWFHSAEVHGCAAGGGSVRSDQYLRDPGQTELGIKRRGGKTGVEVKGLVAKRWEASSGAPFAGDLQLWGKWSSDEIALADGRLVATGKTRWLRKFATAGARAEEVELREDEKPRSGKLPDQGCNVELTEVRLANGDAWWTLGFESFGPVETLAESVRATAALLAERRPPELNGGLVASYPAWLSRHAPAAP